MYGSSRTRRAWRTAANPPRGRAGQNAAKIARRPRGTLQRSDQRPTRSESRSGRIAAVPSSRPLTPLHFSGTQISSVVAQVHAAVHQRRVRPRLAAHLRPGQFLVLLRRPARRASGTRCRRASAAFLAGSPQRTIAAWYLPTFGFSHATLPVFSSTHRRVIVGFVMRRGPVDHVEVLADHDRRGEVARQRLVVPHLLGGELAVLLRHLQPRSSRRRHRAADDQVADHERRRGRLDQASPTFPSNGTAQSFSPFSDQPEQVRAGQEDESACSASDRRRVAGRVVGRLATRSCRSSRRTRPRPRPSRRPSRPPCRRRARWARWRCRRTGSWP